MERHWIVCLLVFVGMALGEGIGAVDAWAADSRGETPAVASRPLELTSESGNTSLPALLSNDDVNRYRRIATLQKKGDWRAADRVIATLDDRLLMGHVLAQRYLHPKAYRSKYKELKGWMAEYADHPDAPRIHKLALRRKPKSWRSPRRPVKGYLSGNGYLMGSASAPPRTPSRSLTKKQRRQARTYDRRIRYYIRKGWTKSVKRLIRSKEVKSLFSRAELDRARARLGAGYFAAGRDEWALEWAGAAAKRSGRYLPEAHWTAALAAWRLKRHDTAGKHFEAVAKMRRASPWMISAAAFWLARTHLVSGRPERFNTWMNVAAKHSRTFYGLLARRILGLPMDFQWNPPPLEGDTAQSLMKSANVRRALALIQLGENAKAERELRGLAGRSDDDAKRGILAVASHAGMPGLTMRLDNLLNSTGNGYDGAAYPVTSWKPAGGYRVDRALIFALIRQESFFNPKAKSRAGASGLMQIMPSTASFVARDRGYRGRKRAALFEPETNLTLGQKYIEMLLADEKIDGDLFLLFTAWNGGPGNLGKWQREIKHLDDSLFFIESIPSRETRIFIERVLTNLWIYRDRMAQATPSLDAIAAGFWPVYKALDPENQLLAENADGTSRQKRLRPR